MKDRHIHLSLVTILTFLRVPLVIVFFVGALVNSLAPAPKPGLFAMSLSCLVAAALTDLFDGHLARKLDVATRFGALADPMTDKVYYLLTLPLLVFLAARNAHTQHAVVLLCFAVLFLLRDQWVTFLRSLGAAFNVDAKANWSGKLRTLISFPLICLIYHYEESGRPLVGPAVLYTIEAVGLAVNLISIHVYTRFYWPFLVRSVIQDLDRAD